MPEVEVDLTDKEFEILQSLEKIEGKDAEKLRSFYRWYLSSIPELKSKEYELKRSEDKNFFLFENFPIRYGDVW